MAAKRGPGPDSWERDELGRLVREEPLCHPGVFVLRFRDDYDCSPPDHLKQIYGDVYRGVTDEDNEYPKKHAHFKPREHGKSAGGTVDNAAWMAAHDPTSRTAIISEGSDLAEGKLEQAANIVKGLPEPYRTPVETDNNDEFELVNPANHSEATIEAYGIDSKVTGGHYDLIVFDDVVDWPSQRTEARREKIWSQFQSYLNLGSEGETVFLVVGTRKHPDDLYSNLIENPAWYSVVDRAIQDWSIVENRDYSLVTRNPRTDEKSEYRAGNAHEIPNTEAIVDAVPDYDVDVLWPERWPLNKLLVDMHAGYGAKKGNLVWMRENQNVADALQGQVLAEDMLDFEEPPPERDMTVSFGLDPASVEDVEKAQADDSDYWALAKVGEHRRSNTTYVLKTWRKRGMSLKQGISWVAGKVDGYRGSVLVEDNHAQRWFVQEAKDEGMNVRGGVSSGSKEERIIDMSPRFESGKVKLAGAEEHWSGRGAPNEKFVTEWCGFPSGSHDDRLDAINKALEGVGGSVMESGDHDMSDLPV